MKKPFYSKLAKKSTILRCNKRPEFVFPPTANPLNPHINLPLVHDIPHQPANHHERNRIQQCAHGSGCYFLKEILADDSGQASSILIPDQVESLGDETGQDIDEEWIFAEYFKKIIACSEACLGVQVDQ